MRTTAIRWLVLALLVTLVACASRERADQLDETLRHYSSLIRWGEWPAAADYYDPELREKRPISELDMERLGQFRVSGYNQRALEVSPDGQKARQSVEIRLYNVHTMAERVIVDQQVWRWDEKAERWWLTSGLPDVTQAR
jgi:hypothetical protein